MTEMGRLLPVVALQLGPLSASSGRSLDVSKEFIDKKNRESVGNDLKQISGAN